MIYIQLWYLSMSKCFHAPPPLSNPERLQQITKNLLIINTGSLISFKMLTKPLGKVVEIYDSWKSTCSHIYSCKCIIRAIGQQSRMEMFPESYEEWNWLVFWQIMIGIIVSQFHDGLLHHVKSPAIIWILLWSQ